uniref:Exocyst complex component Sec6 n=1 Tax=Ditylenchus dipsaci TaxID=166011 RepID=A0A915ELT9_9BILA
MKILGVHYCGCVLSDLCRAFEANIAVIMDEIMAKLFDILSVGLNANFVRYLDSCVKWLTDAIAAAQVTNPEDYDQLDWVRLVGDLLHSFGAEMLQFVESEPVVQMLQRCRRSKLNKAKTVANWVSREVARVKRQVGQA